MGRRPGRQIEELIQIHKRHGSTLREVFVEGNEDKYFYQGFLQRQSRGDVAVLTIDTIEVPTNEVLARGLFDGSRGRVITLAALLDGHVQPNEVICIADADTAYWLNEIPTHSLLLLTDATALDSYACSLAVIEKMIASAIPSFPKTALDVMNACAVTLTPAYAVRAASQKIGLIGIFDDHLNSCDIVRGEVSFSQQRYIDRCFRGCSTLDWQRNLTQALEENPEDASLELRQKVHPHEFRAFVGWYIRRHTGFGHLNAGTIETFLLAFIDDAVLLSSQLFNSLLERFALLVEGV